jgi:hypothetical protein
VYVLNALDSAVGEVAFSALSRLQNDPARLRSYFLKGFSFVLGLILPMTIAGALFADDVVLGGHHAAHRGLKSARRKGGNGSYLVRFYRPSAF